jgi:hypothetical protein
MDIREFLNRVNGLASYHKVRYGYHWRPSTNTRLHQSEHFWQWYQWISNSSYIRDGDEGKARVEIKVYRNNMVPEGAIRIRIMSGRFQSAPNAVLTPGNELNRVRIRYTDTMKVYHNTKYSKWMSILINGIQLQDRGEIFVSIVNPEANRTNPRSHYQAAEFEFVEPIKEPYPYQKRDRHDKSADIVIVMNTERCAHHNIHWDQTQDEAAVTKSSMVPMDCFMEAYYARTLQRFWPMPRGGLTNYTERTPHDDPTWYAETDGTLIRVSDPTLRPPSAAVTLVTPEGSTTPIPRPPEPPARAAKEPPTAKAKPKQPPPGSPLALAKAAAAKKAPPECPTVPKPAAKSASSSNAPIINAKAWSEAVDAYADGISGTVAATASTVKEESSSTPSPTTSPPPSPVPDQEMEGDFTGAKEEDEELKSEIKDEKAEAMKQEVKEEEMSAADDPSVDNERKAAERQPSTTVQTTDPDAPGYIPAPPQAVRKADNPSAAPADYVAAPKPAALTRPQKQCSGCLSMNHPTNDKCSVCERPFAIPAMSPENIAQRERERLMLSNRVWDRPLQVPEWKLDGTSNRNIRIAGLRQKAIKWLNKAREEGSESNFPCMERYNNDTQFRESISQDHKFNKMLTAYGLPTVLDYVEWMERLAQLQAHIDPQAYLAFKAKYNRPDLMADAEAAVAREETGSRESSQAKSAPSDQQRGRPERSRSHRLPDYQVGPEVGRPIMAQSNQWSEGQWWQSSSHHTEDRPSAPGFRRTWQNQHSTWREVQPPPETDQDRRHALDAAEDARLRHIARSGSQNRRRRIYGDVRELAPETRRAATPPPPPESTGDERDAVLTERMEDAPVAQTETVRLEDAPPPNKWVLTPSPGFIDGPVEQTDSSYASHDRSERAPPYRADSSESPPPRRRSPTPKGYWEKMD